MPATVYSHSNVATPDLNVNPVYFSHIILNVSRLRTPNGKAEYKCTINETFTLMFVTFCMLEGLVNTWTILL